VHAAVGIWRGQPVCPADMRQDQLASCVIAESSAHVRLVPATILSGRGRTPIVPHQRYSLGSAAGIEWITLTCVDMAPHLQRTKSGSVDCELIDIENSSLGTGMRLPKSAIPHAFCLLSLSEAADAQVLPPPPCPPFCPPAVTAAPSGGTSAGAIAGGLFFSSVSSVILRAYCIKNRELTTDEAIRAVIPILGFAETLDICVRASRHPSR